MAPLCSDPRQIVIALDQQKRLELLKLVDDVLLYMTQQLDAKPEELGSLSTDSGSDDEDKPTTEANPVIQQETPVVQPQANKNGGFNGAKFMKNIQSIKVPIPWQKKSNNAPTQTTKRADEIHFAALKYMVDWQMEFMPQFEEIIRVKDNEKVIAERRTRQEGLQDITKKDDTKDSTGAGVPSSTTEVDNVTVDIEQDLTSLQALYPPFKNTLSALSLHDRQECLSCILLLILSTGKYSGHSRALVLYLTSSLGLPQAFLNKEEAEIAKLLIESSTADKKDKETMSAEAETAKQKEDNKISRYWKVGLASVAGATIIGVTGGLAAPLVAGALGSILGGVGLGGVASFLGIFWMNGALVGALFGAYGAKMTGSMMDSYAKEVEDFCFIPLETATNQNESDRKGAAAAENADLQGRRLRVTIGINGWLNSEQDITKPWQVLNTDSEVFALRYEMKTLLELGTAIQDLVQSFAWKTLKFEIIKRTVLATLWAALWPIQVMAIASNVDNPFNRASNRSKKAGKILADALINRVQGERPVTLIGYSLGAVTIHACLQSLAERRAFGLIDTVVIIGTPAPSDAPHWRTLRSVVSGKIFNVYSENDMVLGFAYRMHSLSMGVAGLQAIDGVRGIQNLDLSGQVSGHQRYPTLVGEILHQCGFIGVTSNSEIEKDDVIQLKDDYANGKIDDLDERLTAIQMHDNDLPMETEKSRPNPA